ncbi:DUF1643 domain-containing protein [Cupriavidus malaysiensis]|uniref:DUF1643 domain-containing protein n=1 Tax=Cupriavidus malaysiensis TaxID=367825 RepID=UPI001F2D26EB|nr:DUF1643 domain-containing protein [Cupriavidus malaysiensis]
MGGLEVVNLFPLRSTNPVGLLKHPAPLGDPYWAGFSILDALERSAMVICALGAHKAAPVRASEVLRMIRMRGGLGLLHHLGLNRDGSPKHPLYIPAATVPQPFLGRAQFRP